MRISNLIICFFIFQLSLNAQIHTSVDGVVGYDVLISNDFGFGFSSLGSNRSGYRFGANFNFRIFDKGYIKTGLRYTRQGYITYAFNNTPAEFFNTIDEYYLETPILLRYEFNDKRYAPYFEVGGAPYLYLRSRSNVNSFGNVSSGDLDPPHLENKRFRFAIVLAIGFQYKLTHQYLIFMQPTFRYFMPIDYGVSSTVKTSNFGIEVGIRKALTFVEG